MPNSNNGRHPNSLANLKPHWNTETAKEANLKGQAVRRANKEARDKMKMSIAEWKLYKTEVIENSDLTSIDVLRIMMMKAMQDEDMDTALDIAKSLAEFEAPKLARVDQTNLEVSTEEMTDEELDEALRKANEARSG